MLIKYEFLGLFASGDRNVGFRPGYDLDISLLEHVSPIEWDNVVLYGEYVVDRNLIK